MLGVGHMVCAEDARAGIALEWQKIYREWVRLRVQRKLRCPFLLRKAATPVGKTALFATHCTSFTVHDQFGHAPSLRPQLRAPPSWPFQLQCSPSWPYLQSPAPAVRPRLPRAPPLTQALTARLGTVSPEVRKLHRLAVRGLLRGRNES